jgi:hypothetical protein
MEILRGPVVRDVDRARHACVVEVFALYLGYFSPCTWATFSPCTWATFFALYLFALYLGYFFALYLGYFFRPVPGLLFFSPCTWATFFRPVPGLLFRPVPGLLFATFPRNFRPRQPNSCA